MYLSFEESCESLFRELDYRILISQNRVSVHGINDTSVNLTYKIPTLSRVSPWFTRRCGVSLFRTMFHSLRSRATGRERTYALRYEGDRQAYP